MPFGPIIQKRTPTLFAGRLRNRIDIVQPSATQDAAGGFDLNANVVVYSNIWASVEALNGTEKFAAHEFISQASHQVVIRYLPNITSEMQVHFQGRQFQIEAVLNPDERTKSLVLLCVEINDSQQQTAS